MKQTRFRFKQFEVNHFRSAMKVGVDGVLIGAWCDVAGAGSILDVGTGCGLIALMAAQRNSRARVDAIDIDMDSVEEARGNFMESRWKERLRVINISLHELCSDVGKEIVPSHGYDLIVSNPPFFNSGGNPEASRRMAARHQGELSPLALLELAAGLLSERGMLSMIFPSEQLDEVNTFAKSYGWRLRRLAHVKGHPSAPEKRVMSEYVREQHPESIMAIAEETIILEERPGEPTPRYCQLCHDFYLKF